jgi:multidrug efflux pump subunit AcrB
LSVDDARAREFGITPFKIAEALKVRSYGTEIGEFRDDKLLLPILFRLNKNDRDEVFDLRGIIISSEKGEAIPLDKIVKFSVDWEYPVIWRYDNKFSMSIQADTVGELQSPTITNQVLLEINKIKNEFADNVELQVGGTVEESSKGQSSIITGLPIMFFLIFTLLVIQLSSVSKSLLVFVTAPLGVSGALFALILFDMPLGFVAGLGIVALIGMIIRNSVILVDQIERERLSGKDVLNSVVDATLGRFRPIILTAGTAALAMVPLTKSIFWGPMAVAIMGGLGIATILSLILIPILYSIFYSEKTSSKIFSNLK